MLRNTFLKSLRDQRRSYLGWCVSVLLLVAMYVSFWPSMRDQPSIGDFLDQMPEAMRNLFAMAGADMSTPVGFIKVEFLSFMGPILVLLYTILAGSGAVAGEEDRRTLDLLLSTPAPRWRVVLEKAAAMALGTLGLVVLLAAAILVMGAVVDMDLPASKVAVAMVHLGLLGLVFGALALAIGAATGRLGLSRGMPAFVAVVAYIVNGLGGFVDWMRPLQKWSPFYQYAGHDPLVNGLSWPSVAVALGTIVVLVGVAAWAFERRDIRT